MKKGSSFVAKLVRAIPSRQNALVVASPGRSGSTLLFEAATRAMSQVRFGKPSRFTKDFAWDLGSTRLRPGIVYKTHDYPDALSEQEKVRSVFVFGSAKDNVMSVLHQKQLRGRHWMKTHLENLKSTECSDDLLERDVMGIMDQMIMWSTSDASPVLCVRYDALWDAQESIRTFSGLPIELPKRRLRRTKEVSRATLEKLEKIYDPIDARVSRLPDVYLSSPSMGDLLLTD